jgi:large repetitive protein
VTSETLLRGTKFVQGDRDSSFIPGPGVGNTTRGGTAEYQAQIRNVSDVPVTNVIVVDTLPIPGDIGVKDPAPRDSGWQPFFAGQFTANPPAASVQYSTAHNPCRDDLSVSPPGCVPANWGPLPADVNSVGAIRVDFGSLVLNPNDTVTFRWGMNVPADAPLDSIAWNSFGYVATRIDNGSLLESAEPQKVGLQVIGPGPPPPPPCPNCQPIPPTGADADVMAIVAVVLLTGGLTLLAVSRRPSARAAAG